MGHGPGRPVKSLGRPHGRGARHSSSSIVHRMSWATVRAGPSKHTGRLKGRAERPILSPHLMGRGPARPGPSIFKKARPGPARHNFQIGPARPGPDKRPMTSPENNGSLFFFFFSTKRFLSIFPQACSVGYWYFCRVLGELPNAL